MRRALRRRPWSLARRLRRPASSRREPPARPARPRWCTRSTATRSSCASAARRSRCASSASTPPSPWRRDRPVECFGPEAKAPHRRAAARGHRGAPRARRRGPRRVRPAPRLRRSAPTTACSSTCSSWRRATPSRRRSRRTSPTRPSFDRGRGRAPGHDQRGPLARLRRHRRPDRTGSVGAVTTLAERLGYGPDDRLVISTATTSGSCHAANVGVYEALRDGLATSATLMVPCPWARDAAAALPGRGRRRAPHAQRRVDRYRWGPITHAPSLLDGDGGFPRTVTDVWDHADLDEVRRELRAQVERAILWGFDVSHLDSHMGALQLRPEFFDVYLDLAVEFGLPLRLSGAVDRAGRSASRSGASPPRRAWCSPTTSSSSAGVGSPARVRARSSADLRPGVTELLRPPRRRHARAAGGHARLGGPGRRPRARHAPTTAVRHDARRGRRPAHRLPPAPRPPAGRLAPDRLRSRWRRPPRPARRGTRRSGCTAARP